MVYKKKIKKKKKEKKKKKKNTPPYKRDTREAFIQSQHSQNCIPNSASLDTIVPVDLVSWELSAID